MKARAYFQYDYKSTDDEDEHGEQHVTRSVQIMFSYKLRCKQMHIYKACTCIDSFVYTVWKKKNTEHYIKGYVRYHKYTKYTKRVRN